MEFVAYFRTALIRVVKRSLKYSFLELAMMAALRHRVPIPPVITVFSAIEWKSSINSASIANSSTFSHVNFCGSVPISLLSFTKTSAPPSKSAMQRLVAVSLLIFFSILSWITWLSGVLWDTGMYPDGLSPAASSSLTLAMSSLDKGSCITEDPAYGSLGRGTSGGAGACGAAAGTSRAWATTGTAGVAWAIIGCASATAYR
mmetsp:Transcript_38769/g.60460  ORF Transcript_38769/g.60460 Transcript_38769/m.60460 type:complete len:202 (+) Transcript_38769:50-655(+)